MGDGMRFPKAARYLAVGLVLGTLVVGGSEKAGATSPVAARNAAMVRLNRQVRAVIDPCVTAFIQAEGSYSYYRQGMGGANSVQQQSRHALTLCLGITQGIVVPRVLRRYASVSQYMDAASNLSGDIPNVVSYFAQCTRFGTCIDSLAGHLEEGVASDLERLASVQNRISSAWKVRLPF
jgi:hypothetical protein